tara:strand:- start:704 stop:2101 length:1398 start_codon:yes stop_codon:yes gene_type:complete
MAINPLPAPINYMGSQINLSEQFSGLGDVLAKQQAKTLLEDQQKQYVTDFQATVNDPSQKSFANLLAKHGRSPAIVSSIESARKQFGEERIKNEFNQGFQISNALENNNTEVANKLLQEIITAKTNSKEPLGLYGQAAKFLEDGNTKAAQGTLNLALSNIDPDQFTKIVNAKSTAEAAPSSLTKKIADADEAVAKAKIQQAKATNAQEMADAELAVQKAEQVQSEIKAKYANENALAGLEKMAADLGLTNAQKNKALVDTSKLSIEVKKAALELAALQASGGVDPAKNFEQEEKLRKEYTARTKSYGEVSTILSNLEASANAKNGPGDIALITGFMKMLDPGSVVRETEFATAKDTAGLYERLRNSSQKLQSGQLFALDSKQRQEYVALAKQYHDAAQKKAGEDKKALGVVVKNYKLNPDNVFGPEPTASPTSANSVVVNGQTFNRPANFTDAQWESYKKSQGIR